jgi:hypothetical protein
MPKEQINFAHWRKMLHGLPGLPGLRGSDEGATAEMDDILYVRWHDGSQVKGYVQLTVVSHEPQPWEDYEGADCWPPNNTATERFLPPLSRDELNRLIRVLRRARDSAFGRDE